MKNYDVIIIGAGPAGIVTGVTVRKQYPDKTVLILKEEEKGLIPCGIPYVFHELNSVDKNIMGLKPFIDLGGEVATEKVVDIDKEKKLVKTKQGSEFAYRKLILATGSIPFVPKFIPGYDLKNIFYIKKSYNYISSLFEELKDKKNIIIVGGGFIGAEVAEQLSKFKDKNVTIIEKEDLCFSKAFSSELSKIATEQLKKTNVNVYTSLSVKEFIGRNGAVTKVKLNTGKELDADAVILSMGYVPNTSLAEKTGLNLNEYKAIIVDNFGHTSAKHIYAVGDCSETIGFLTGRKDNIMLASTATSEARILGYNLFGIRIRNSFTGTIAVFSTEINGLAMASAGVNDKDISLINLEIISAKFTGVDRHPASLPGTSPLTVKLYVSPSDGSILGGEVWGSKSSGEIINIIALAIQEQLTVFKVLSYQIGTHPLLTNAPTMPAFIKAAEIALSKIYKN
jgi:NADPH-dependent 2,4-dienoyl-CoA reductase/sulfur reductase-like enzyme